MVRRVVRRERFSKQVNLKRSKDLFKDLEAIHKELAALKQENFDVSSLDTLKKQLVDKSLLKSKDEGLKIFVACCLSDIFRLTAPEPPYPDDLQNTILLFFIDQLEHVGDEANPYFAGYNYLLENIVQIQCMALICQSHDHEKLINTVFNKLYACVQHKPLSNNTANKLGSILVQIILEAGNLPREAVQLVCSQLNDNASSISSSLSSAGSRLSKYLFTEAHEDMPVISLRYFSKILEELNIKKDVDFKSDAKLRNKLELVQRHLCQVWSVAPEALHGLIGQLEELLNCRTVSIRLMVTQVVGRMLQLSQLQVKCNVISIYETLSKNWFLRATDIEPSVRSAWATDAIPIMTNNPTFSKRMGPLFIALLYDVNENVRTAACMSLKKVQEVYSFLSCFPCDYSTLVDRLCDRLCDKNVNVRREAFSFLGALYDSAYDTIQDSPDDVVSKCLGSIPFSLLKLIYVNNMYILEQLDDVLQTKIFPYPGRDNHANAVRFLTAISSLPKDQYKILETLAERQSRLNRALELYSNDINNTSYDDLTRKAKVAVWANWFGRQFADCESMRSAITWFAEWNNNKAKQLFQCCISDTSDISTVRISLKELGELLTDLGFNYRVAPLRALLYRGGHFFYNQSYVPTITEMLSDENSQKLLVADNVLLILAKQLPRLVLLNSVTVEASIISSTCDSRFLKLKAACLAWGSGDKDERPQSPQFWSFIKNLALHGNVKEAKYAVRLLDLSETRTRIYKEILEHLLPCILEISSQGLRENNEKSRSLASYLAAVAELYLHAPQFLEDDAGNLTKTLIDHVILAQNGDISSDSESWGSLCTLERVSVTRIVAVKVLVNRLRGIHKDKVIAVELAKPVLKLLSSIMRSESTLAITQREKLEAALSLIKLCRHKLYSNMVTPLDLTNIGALILNLKLPGRQKLLKSITKDLVKNGIPEKMFFPLLFMVAKEKDETLADYVTTWIKAKCLNDVKTRKTSNKNLEMSFCTFLAYLAHIHGFMPRDNASPKHVQEREFLFGGCSFIVYYLCLVANETNISLFFYLVSRIKQFRDKLAYDNKENIEQPERLYMLSEVADICLRKLQTRHSWDAPLCVTRYSLPKDCYERIVSSDDKLESWSKTYIPEELVAELEQRANHEITAFESSKRIRP